MTQTGRIGIFDSGIGGLTTLASIRAELPQYSYVYLGDTARAPYGPRSQEDIYTFTREAVQFLKSEGCELIIIACNTASAEALRRIQQELAPRDNPFRVLGIIAPLVERATETSMTGRIAVMATQATVESHAYTRELQKRLPHAHILEVACPDLVPLIESGKSTDEIKSALNTYCAPVIAHHADTVILGCTHYGHIKNEIAQYMSPHTALICEEDCIGALTRSYLETHEKLSTLLSHTPSCTLYATRLTDVFVQRARELINVEPECRNIASA